MTEITNPIENSNWPSTSDILANIDSIPLPIEIKKSLWKSVGRLITGLVDVPVAYLEAKVQQIRTEANALTLVTKNASDAAAKEFGQDQFLIDRTVNHFGSKLLREQINREKTVQLAIDDLKANPPKEDSSDEIDSDWLETFSKIAETKSNADVQLFLSKILSGEIRKPGTFSPRTIQTLSLLDQQTAQIFQALCDISFEIPAAGDKATCVITEPFGSVGSNDLQSLGLKYEAIAQLQDAGLVQSELNTNKQIPGTLFRVQFSVGSKNYHLKLSPETPNTPTAVKSLLFTKVGLELRKILVLKVNEEYNSKFIPWLITKFKLVE
jgi:hypothetical protein